MHLEERVPLAPLTTFGVGGVAEYYARVSSADELRAAAVLAKEHKLPFWVLAGGSNVVCGDIVPGVCIHLASGEVSVDSDTLRADAGAPLSDFVDASLTHGFAGAEGMTGIPGSVGGAIVGNAGAYGQTISDHLLRVEVWDGATTRWFLRDECDFGYRRSLFGKERGLLVLSAEFSFPSGDSAALLRRAQEVRAEREKKYAPGIRCPGSFFKNVLIKDLSPEVLQKMPPMRDFYGKVPAWFFLNEVGARGMRVGGLRVADIHGNLVVNEGGAAFEDVVSLAQELKRRVRERFGLELEEEVRYIV